MLNWALSAKKVLEDFCRAWLLLLEPCFVGLLLLKLAGVVSSTSSFNLSPRLKPSARFSFIKNAFLSTLKAFFFDMGLA